MSRNKKTSESLFQFMNLLIALLLKNGQYRTMLHYKATLNSFKRYRDNKDIALRKIDAEVMRSYEAYLHHTVGVCKNTSSFYLRKSDLKDGYLHYTRSKTGQRLTIRWEKEMQEVLEKYQAQTAPHLISSLSLLMQETKVMIKLLTKSRKKCACITMQNPVSLTISGARC